jgi:alpha-ketoglutarate-dependent taurine dioxygenase
MSEAITQLYGHAFPPERSFALIPSDDGGDPCRSIIQAFAEHDFHVTRDVIVSTQDVAGDLTAQAGDFWFHTDGVFLEPPPRWVVIQVLEAEQGGELHVLNAAGLRDSLPSGDVLFGQPHRGVTAPLVVAAASGQRVFRYRQDYMHPLSGGADLEAAHRVVSGLAEQNAVPLGALAPYDCLVLDNWWVMHRRESFSGRRVIRRLWLS